MKEYKNLLAHLDKEDHMKKQYLMEHLFEVSRLAKNKGIMVNLESTCELIGLLHDFGKYRHKFQIYIKGEYKGKVNHSSTGARILTYIQSTVEKKHNGKINENLWKLYKELLEYPILSHHGLYDIIDDNLDYRTGIRLDYDSNEIINDLEFLDYLDKEFENENDKSIYDLYYEGFIEFEQTYKKLYNMANKLDERLSKKKALYFYYGALIRLLLSILKDADIYDSSNYYRSSKDIVYSIDDLNLIWNQMGKSIEDLYLGFEKNGNTELDRIRTELANELLEHSKESQNGAYKLSTPVGGGKTFASLRYSIENCKGFNKSRTFYCTAYLSVLEQNASSIKNVLGEEYILEHHSNIIEDYESDLDEDDQKEYQVNEYLKESWESPVILTTLVQLSNTMFKDKASNIRRFSKLINSVIMIDEIQSLPNKAIYNFNLMMNFLSNIMNCNIIHSTATPPNLDNKGALVYPCFYEARIKDTSILDLPNSLAAFHRVNYYSLLGKELNITLNTKDAINHVKSQLKNENSALIILNTKRAVSNIYTELLFDSELDDLNCEIIYLTTNQCAAHRLEIIRYMKERLKELRSAKSNRKLICVSTKLIEAGVDIDFDLVYRSLAGIDSVIQSGGRCNREGEKLTKGRLFIFEYEDENLKYLAEIQKQRDAAKSALRSLKMEYIDEEPIDIEQACDYYFQKLFSNEETGGKTLEFPINKDDTILDLLTTNLNGKVNYENKHGKDTDFKLLHSFKTAATEFDLIRENTLSVIVQYNNEQLINELYEAIEDWRFYDVKSILKKLQPYTIALRRGDELRQYTTKELDGEIYILTKDAYSKEVGLNKDELQSLVY